MSAGAHKLRGLSLIEVMVGLVIGLVTILMIGQVLSAFEARKRTTTSGGNAQLNSSVAMMAMEREIRMAGYGLVLAGMGTVNPGTLVCPLGVNIYHGGRIVSDPGATAVPASSTILAPVRIEDGGTGNPDVVTIVRSDAATGMQIGKVVAKDGTAPAAALTATFSSTGTSSGTPQLVGFPPGQLFLVGAQDGTKTCSLFQVSQAPALSAGATTTAWNLYYAAATAYPYNSPDPTADFAKAEIPGAGDVVVNVGFSPPATGVATKGGSNLRADRGFVYRRYSVEDGRLAVVDPSQEAPPYTSANTLPLVDEIVDIQAQYGIAETGTFQNIDRFVEPTGAWAATALTAQQIGRIKAIRIAVVARSPQLEKEEVSPASITLWTAGSGDDPAPVFTVPDRHYRYKVFTTVAAMKNVIWGRLP